MVERIGVLQSDLAKRSATAEEQEELNIRTEEIGAGTRKDEELFDTEPKEKGKENDPPPKEPEKKPENQEGKKTEEGEKSDADLLEAKDEDLDDAQKTRKAELVEAKKVADAQVEEDRILETEDKDLDDKGKTRKAELVKAKKDADDKGKTEEQKKAEFEENVKSYVTEHQVSEEAAREDLGSISKIRDNFKDDPQRLAKSFLHVQRLYTRTTEELKALKNKADTATSPANVKDVVEAIGAGELTMNGKAMSKEQAITAYRQKEDIDESVDDNVVVKMIAKDMVTGLKFQQQENLTKLSGEAKVKREKLVSELSEADKKFLPMITPLMNGHTDHQIMSDKYNLGDLVLWAKGKNYEKDIKEAGEREFKRGVETRKIIGDIKKPGDGKSKTKTSKTKTSLTTDQMAEAEEHFANDNISLERKYELYADVLEHKKKLDGKGKKGEEK